jgi:hypothetical protein
MSDRWMSLLERPREATSRGTARLAASVLGDRFDPASAFGRSRALELFNRFNEGGQPLSPTLARLNLPGDCIARAFTAFHDWTHHTGDARPRDTPADQ